jgi:membrane fusion protein, multidrug efflux system
MVPITAQVTDDGHKYWLRPGSFCDVSIDLGAKRDAPLIPRSAARATDHGYVAYVVSHDTAEERPLTLGMSTRDGWVEVRSGLKAGETLVVRGAEALSSGAKVHANPVTPESLNNDSTPSASPGTAQ